MAITVDFTIGIGQTSRILHLLDHSCKYRFSSLRRALPWKLGPPEQRLLYYSLYGGFRSKLDPTLIMLVRHVIDRQEGDGLSKLQKI
jgi:hypothetical protein